MSLSLLGKAFYSQKPDRAAPRPTPTHIHDADVSAEYKSRNPISLLAPHPDGRIAALISKDSTELVSVNNSSADSQIRHLSTPSNYLKSKTGAYVPNAATWQPPAPSGSYGTLVVSDQSGKIRLFDLQNQQDLKLTLTSASVGRSIKSLSFNSEQPNLFAAGVSDGSTRCYDLRQGMQRPVSMLSKSGDITRQCEFQPNSEFKLACIYDSGVVQQWDLRQQRMRDLRINAHQQGLSLNWHPLHPRYLVTGGRDHLLQVWNMQAPVDLALTPEYVVQVPNSVSLVKWASSKSDYQGKNENEVWKTKVVCAGRPIESFSMRTTYSVYSLEEPFAPLNTVERHTDAVTAIEPMNSQVVWSVGLDGRFVQTDLRYEPLVRDNFPRSIVAMPPWDMAAVSFPCCQHSEQLPPHWSTLARRQSMRDPRASHGALSSAPSTANLAAAGSNLTGVPPVTSPSNEQPWEESLARSGPTNIPPRITRSVSSAGFPPYGSNNFSGPSYSNTPSLSPGSVDYFSSKPTSPMASGLQYQSAGYNPSNTASQAGSLSHSNLLNGDNSFGSVNAPMLSNSSSTTNVHAAAVTAANQLAAHSCNPAAAANTTLLPITKPKYVLEIGLPYEEGDSLRFASSEMTFIRQPMQSHAEACRANARVMHKAGRFTYAEVWSSLAVACENIEADFLAHLSGERKDLCIRWFDGQINEHFEVRSSAIDTKRDDELFDSDEYEAHGGGEWENTTGNVTDPSLFTASINPTTNTGRVRRNRSGSRPKSVGSKRHGSASSKASSTESEGLSRSLSKNLNLARANTNATSSGSLSGNKFSRNSTTFDGSSSQRPMIELEKDPFMELKEDFFEFAGSQTFPWQFWPMLKRAIELHLSNGYYTSAMALLVLFRALPQLWECYNVTDIIQGGLLMLDKFGSFVAAAAIRNILRQEADTTEVYSTFVSSEPEFDQPDTICFRCRTSLSDNAAFYARNDAVVGYWYCLRCRLTLDGCSYCDEPITGLCRLITECGHRLHPGCWELWFTDEGMSECPSGCGQPISLNQNVDEVTNVVTSMRC